MADEEEETVPEDNGASETHKPKKKKSAPKQLDKVSAEGSKASNDSEAAKDRISSFFSYGVLFVVFLIGLGMVTHVFDGGGGPLHGAEAPAFDLPVIANAEAGHDRISLASYKGHPVLLDFWATWCGPCRQQSPVVDAVAEHFKEKGLVVLGVNVDDKDLAKQWVRQTGTKYPMLFDEKSDAQRAYQVNNLPTLVVVDKTGKVHAFRQGFVPRAQLESLVEEVL